MGVGMFLHRIPFGPNSYSYSFTKTVIGTVSPLKGTFDLLFYVPKDYKKNEKKDHSDPSRKKYPVVVNFHGGGFTIGAAHDDSRWADAVVNHVGAVVVNVEYRLAPEHPFPTAVEDGADAILYLIDHADALGIDPDRIGISGFSAGGNMAFTVPLMLQREFQRRAGTYKKGVIVDREGRDATAELHPLPKGKIQAIMAWYPPTDYSLTRTERRATNVRQDKSLPEFFTTLFDAAYLYDRSNNFDLKSPYLSPGLAPDEMLTALPDDIIMYICEWDELRAEAEVFRDRLKGLPGKKVVSRVIEGVMHGFDKGPNPLWRDQDTENLYADACVELKRALNKDYVTEVQVGGTGKK
jgi:putative ergosteryl-3beta-O-L-aspartate hydrolase